MNWNLIFWIVLMPILIIEVIINVKLIINDIRENQFRDNFPEYFEKIEDLRNNTEKIRSLNHDINLEKHIIDKTILELPYIPQQERCNIKNILELNRQEIFDLKTQVNKLKEKQVDLTIGIRKCEIDNKIPKFIIKKYNKI